MELIQEATTLYKEIQNLDEIKYQKQMRIAEICIEVCAIKQGNYRGKGKYNLSNFAKDSDIPRSSLKEWVDTLKRIIPVVGVTNIKSDDDWNRAKKVASKHRQKRKSPDEEILKVFNEPSVATEFRTLCDLANRFTKFFRTKDLNLIKDHDLLELMYKIDEVSDTINTHLTKKREAHGNKRQNQRIG